MIVLAERSRAEIVFTIDKPEGPITGRTTGKQLYPRSGNALLWHDGDRWSISTVAFKGNRAKADGTEGSRTGSAWFSDPLGDIPVDVEGGDEPWEPELPEWLIRDLAAIVSRFNGEAEHPQEDAEAVEEPECQDAEIAAAKERAPITLPTIPGNRYILDWPIDRCCGDSYCGHAADGYVPDDVLTLRCADCRPGGVEGDPIHVGDIEQSDNALAELLHMIATHETEAKTWHDEAAVACVITLPALVLPPLLGMECLDDKGNEYPEHDYADLECRRCGAETPQED